MKFLNFFIYGILFSIVVLLILFIHVAEINSFSMRPTLEKNDKVIYTDIFVEPYKKGDVLLFTLDDKLYIKRCVATSGAKISLSDNSNESDSENLWQKEFIVPSKGMKINTPNEFIIYQDLIERYEDKIITVENQKIFLDDKQIVSYTFKSDYYFMKGDNVISSIDSRNYGPISAKFLKGKMLFKL